ncbi:TetR family transcriptional regulator [Rhodococcus qingshengii]|uniref:TetR/AcrR family transcriptional regulator n=1 Tax=Rhodococcus qingshengii TaxID=334542 RepID=UPI0011EBA26F|nr:TetR family transcriptional regulator [Rhodococcus qingshengii]QEM30900.1 TetR family transcriptional regulator [Rhodococcus qingshengii]WOI88024.1 TetR family transcriptional regulator [Rhodococcus qingshengii]
MRSAGEATRDRILAAAKDEFATYGLAGARINRIAAQARASKDRLYAYFASKEELFAAVTEQWTSETTAETALRGDDLPGYAGRLFDNYVAHPENVRLQQWADLEAPDVMSEDDIRSKTFRPKVAEIRKGQLEGHIDPAWNPTELILLITDIARMLALKSSRSIPRRREAAVEAVRRLIVA